MSGVNISGAVSSVGGDIVGRDKIINQGSSRELEEALRPFKELISTSPQENRAEALAKLAEMRKEVAKGGKSDDGVVANLIGLVGLIPGAASAVVKCFRQPILGAIAGPVTNSTESQNCGRFASRQIW